MGVNGAADPAGAGASRRRWLAGYGLAVAAVAAATLMSTWLWQLTRPAPSILFFPAIMIVALYGGFGPALFATMLAGASVAFFLLPPYYSFKAQPIELVRLAVFASITTIVTWLTAGKQRAEAALLELAAGLERQVEERTAELELTHRAMEASRRLEAIGHLAGGIAHDFSNLLTIVIGNCEVLGDGLPADSPMRPLVAEIQAAADRGAKLTRQLLAYARRQPLRLERVSLDAVIEETLPLITHLTPGSVHVVTRLEAGAPLVLADRVQLEQVLMNLCTNAADAMPDGGALTLETTRVDCRKTSAAEPHGLPPGAYVRLEVRDTGAGMDADTLRHAIEPFFTTKPVGQGSGLGLSTVYGIVRQLGGDLTMDSAVGEGTRVILYLPVAPDAGPAARPDARAIGGTLA